MLVVLVVLVVGGLEGSVRVGALVLDSDAHLAQQHASSSKGHDNGHGRVVEFPEGFKLGQRQVGRRRMQWHGGLLHHEGPLALALAVLAPRRTVLRTTIFARCDRGCSRRPRWPATEHPADTARPRRVGRRQWALRVRELGRAAEALLCQQQPRGAPQAEELQPLDRLGRFGAATRVIEHRRDHQPCHVIEVVVKEERIAVQWATGWQSCQDQRAFGQHACEVGGWVVGWLVVGGWN